MKRSNAVRSTESEENDVESVEESSRAESLSESSDDKCDRCTSYYLRKLGQSLSRDVSSAGGSVRSWSRGKGLAIVLGISLGVVFQLGFQSAGSVLRGGGNDLLRRKNAETAALNAADAAAAQAVGFQLPQTPAAVVTQEVPEMPEGTQEVPEVQEMTEAPEESKENELDCEIATAEADESRRVTPTFAASFPGSGARMTWNLITALTGQVTAEDWQMTSAEDIARVAAIKTHFPHPHGREWPSLTQIGTPEDWGPHNIHRGMILLRNPLDAIPSFHNYLYEADLNLDGHSTRAPTEVWLQWRDTPGEIRCVRAETTGYHDGDIVKDYAQFEAVTGDEWTWRDCAKMCGANPECQFWTLERFDQHRCRLKKNMGQYHEILDPDNDYREGYYHVDCVHQTNFMQELRFWERFVGFWMDHFPKQDRAIMSYEGFTKNESGPQTTAKLADFLRLSDGVNVADPKDIPCIWEKVVNYRKSSSSSSSASVMDIAKSVGYGDTDRNDQPMPLPQSSEIPAEKLSSNTPMVPPQMPTEEHPAGQDPMYLTTKEVLAGEELMYPPPMPIEEVPAGEDLMVPPPMPTEEIPAEEASSTTLRRRRLQAAPIHFNREDLRTDGIAAQVDPTDPHSHRTGSKVRPYTQDQLDLTLAMLQRLIQKFSHEQDLVDILASYVEQVQNKQPDV